MMSMWEFQMKMNAYERMERRLLDKFRVLASIVISPHVKKSTDVSPNRIWPVENNKQPSSKESFQEALAFFNRKKIKEKVIN